MTTDFTFSSRRTSVLSLALGVLALLVGLPLAGCDQGGINDDGDNIIAPSTSRVSFEVRPGATDTTQQLTLTYTDLDERPTLQEEVPDPFTIEMVEETGSPGDGSSVFDVTFSPPQDISSFTERILFRAGSRSVTIQLFGSVGFDDELITDYAGSGVVDETIGFNGIGATNLGGALALEGMDAGGSGVFPGVVHILDGTVDFSSTQVLVVRMKVETSSAGPAIVRAALNQVGDLPDANTSADPLIKEVPADGEYRDYYFDFRGLFTQFDGQPVDATNIGEVVLLVNDGASLDFLGRNETFTGTIEVDRIARRPDIPGEEDTNPAPNASFIFAPNQPEVGETVNFTDQSSDDGMIASRDWEFGDGTTATGETPSHTYSAAGDYTVTLTVTDDEGASSSASQTVSVSDGSGGGGGQFRGDDDMDGLITFDDFEDGIQSQEYDTFQGGGASISLAESSDVPMGSNGTTSLAVTIDGGSGGGFAGFSKTDGVDLADLGSDPYFTMYVQSDASTNYELEINLQEDEDGNGTYDGTGAVDDEFQYNYLVESSTTGWTRISVPLSAFTDDNSVNGVNNGGNGQLSSRIANVVLAVGNLPAESFTVTVDDIIFSDQDLGSGGGGNVQGACDTSEYELFYEDDFNSFNDSFWDKREGTFQGNLAYFQAENITYENGKMVFTLRKEQVGNNPYTGAELRTNDLPSGFYSYGCYEVRMKSAGPSGTVSSFFSYRFNPWQEIDIEIVGKNNRSMLTNIYFNDGQPGDANNDPFQVPPFPEPIGLSYDASQEFHNYAFEWSPGEIKWYRDGQLVKQATVEGVSPDQIPDLDMQIMMNLWVSNAPSFAGEVDDSNFPVRSEYDWVKLYRPAN